MVGVLFLVFAFSASPVLAHRGRVFGPSFGGPGSGAGQLSLGYFTETSGNQSLTTGGSGLGISGLTHDVYVADTGNNRVDEFTSAGAFVRAWGWGVENGASEFQICTESTGCRAGLSGTSPGQFEKVSSVAVDDSPGGKGDVYIADYSTEEGPKNRVQKFTAEGALIGSWGSKGQIDNTSVPAGVFYNISGVAVSMSGDLLVGTGGGVFEFAQSLGTYITRNENISTEFPNGFAVDGTGNFYFYSGTNVRKYSSNGVLEGEIFEPLTPAPRPAFNGPSPATGFAVASSGELYVDEGNAIQLVASSCVSLCAPTTTFSSPLLTKGAGLTVDSQRGAVYIAETAADKIESVVPEPSASPLVEAGSQTVSDVSGDSAILEAVLNPRGESSEEPTSYRFQYTTEERFQREGFAGASGAPVPDGQLAPSFEADLVTVQVQGLALGTVYHFRLVAENAISRQEGKPTEGERNETGKEIARTFTTQTAGVFSLPDGRAWELVSPADKHGALLTFHYGNGVSQAAADGSAVAYLATTPTEAQPPGNSNLTQVLSTRAGGLWGSRDISTPRDIANGLNEGILEEDRFFSSDLSLAVVQPFGVFVPSLSSEASEQTAYLRSNYMAGNPEDPCVSSCYRPLVTGAPGFANVPEGTEFAEPSECRAGNLVCGPEFLGASPDGTHIVLTSKVALIEGAPAFSLYEWANGRLQLVSVLPEEQPAPASSTPKLGVQADRGGSDAIVMDGAVSADGSRIVWSTGVGASRRLYVRDMAREETVELGGLEARFQTASVDGSRIFFTVKGDLYVFAAPLDGALSAGHTTELTPGGGVLETVLGASRDGSSVYFVATTVLTGTLSPRGEDAQAGQPNLYVYNAGTIGLVAVLSNHDRPDWGTGGPMTTTRVSPDGRWLAFMSERSLTGYDNRDVSSGVRDEEVFLYDAAAGGGQGELVCASCNPTGARPHGLLDVGSAANIMLADEQQEWAGRWLAGNIPAWVSSLYQSRYLSDSGRLFFDSNDALAPSDTNGTEDVYEYEPSGVGGCTNERATFSVRSDGCVDLISSGVSTEESAFVDASENGDDVFFFTSAQLSSTDKDTGRDVYDARVAGGFLAPQPPPACEGDACQSPVAAPNDRTPGSLTYQGPGNPGPLLTVSKTAKRKALKCTKGKKLSHGKCVKRKKKARKAAKSGRADNKRGVRS
jgi:Tol biopolymer transport system component